MLQGLAPRVVVIGDLREAFARGVLALRLDRDRRAVEIVEQRVHPLLEQRQPVLHAGMAAAFAHGCVENVIRTRGAEGRHIAGAEFADGVGGELEFGDRHEIEPAHVHHAALVLGIEAADGL